MLLRGYEELNWYGGVMFWEYFSDTEGIAVENATGELI